MIRQQNQSADGGVDDSGNNAGAEVNTELRKQPTTDEGAYYSDDDIADDPKPGALHDLTGQPSGNDADDQYDQETFNRHVTLSQFSNKYTAQYTSFLSKIDHLMNEAKA
jgi:hypothetical protein